MTSLQITSSDIKFTDSNGTTSQTTAYTPLTGHENNEFILPKITVTSNNISAIGSTFPIGGILTSLSKVDDTISSGVPYGFLICNGMSINRITFSKLFAVIGTNYGSGDGSTTFNLPNFNGRIPIGSTTGITNVAKFQTDYFNGGTGSTYFAYTGNSLITENQMASHSHTIDFGDNTDGTTPSQYLTSVNTDTDTGQNGNSGRITSLTTGNFTGNGVDNFPSSQDEYIPKWLAVNYYIKYDY